MIARLIGNHRQDARREVQRQPAEQHEQQNREGTPALEKSLLFYAGLGISNEPEEVVGRDIPAVACCDGEPIKKGECARAIAATRWGRHRYHRSNVRSTAGSKRDRVKDVGVSGGTFPAALRNRQRPENVSRDRCVAEAVVAGLIAEASGYLHASDWRCCRNIEPNADREFVFEYQQRLRLADLIELGRRWENDLADGHSLWRVHGEHRRNKGRVSRRIRLDVKPLWNSNLESGADRRTRRRIGLDERRQFRPDRPELRDSYLR